MILFFYLSGGPLFTEMTHKRTYLVFGVPPLHLALISFCRLKHGKAKGIPANLPTGQSYFFIFQKVQLLIFCVRKTNLLAVLNIQTTYTRHQYHAVNGIARPLTMPTSNSIKHQQNSFLSTRWNKKIWSLAKWNMINCQLFVNICQENWKILHFDSWNSPQKHRFANAEHSHCHSCTTCLIGNQHH